MSELDIASENTLQDLVDKYDVIIQIDESPDVDTPNAYFMQLSGTFIYLGCTVDEVKQRLEDIYGQH